MALIEVNEKFFEVINSAEFHEGFEKGLKGLKALKEKNLEDENLKFLRESILLIYGFDIFNVREDFLKILEENGFERLTKEEKIKLALQDEKFIEFVNRTV